MSWTKDQTGGRPDAADLLLSQYHPLEVFELSLQPSDLLTVQSHVEAAGAVGGRAQVWEEQNERTEGKTGQTGEGETWL